MPKPVVRSHQRKVAMIGKDLREVLFIQGPFRRGEHFTGKLTVYCPHCKKATAIADAALGLKLDCGCRWWAQEGRGWVRFGE
jgi:hypothetical protein